MFTAVYYSCGERLGCVSGIVDTSSKTAVKNFIERDWGLTDEETAKMRKQLTDSFSYLRNQNPDNFNTKFKFSDGEEFDIGFD